MSRESHVYHRMISFEKRFGEHMRNTVIFSLKKGLSTTEQDALVDGLRNWPGVDSVGRLYPESPDPEDLRTFFLYTDTNADTGRLMRRLKRDWKVETVSLQPQRYAAAI